MKQFPQGCPRPVGRAGLASRPCCSVTHRPSTRLLLGGKLQTAKSQTFTALTAPGRTDTMARGTRHT